MKTNSELAKIIIKDINHTLTLLRKKKLLRDESGITQNLSANNQIYISYSFKNDSSNITYDKNISYIDMFDALLSNRQYTLLLYDKGLVQAEFIICNGKIIKERLTFYKKHNKIWGLDEINEYESSDIDWYSEEFGMPLTLRIDYSPYDHVECKHAATHLTISNIESCRIPLKSIITFSDFMKFILYHFYDIWLGEYSTCYQNEDTITDLERKMLHINWI